MKNKKMITAVLAVNMILPVPVYAEDGQASEEDLTMMQDTIGHEYADETAYMEVQNPLDDGKESESDSYIELTVGFAYQLSSKYPPADLKNNQIIWTVSDESVLRIDESGQIFALKQGKAFVSAYSQDGSWSETFEVDVTPVYSESVSISMAEASIVCGETMQLSATIEPANATNQNIVWSADDENIISIDQTGNITALNPGTAVVTAMAEDENAMDECRITVLFDDVADSSRYYFEPVYWAFSNEFTTGTGDGKFSPESSVTRGQMVTFLWRVAGMPEPETSSSFSDVTEDRFFYKAVSWAAENGITTGTGKNRFSPDQKCTREQIVTFLWRFEGEPDDTYAGTFNDVKRNAYYQKAVSWAAEKGITVGLNDNSGRFGTGISCSRGMAVTFLYRSFLGVSAKNEYFENVTDPSGRTYQVYVRNGRIVTKGFKLNQIYYQVDPETGEIIHQQKLFTDEIYFEGIDISSHNGEIDLRDYENGFVIIRIAWGTNTDALAVRNMDLCEKLKIPYGVYLYSYAINDEQAESEADYVLDLIKGRDIQLGVWFDIEDDSYKSARISGWPNSTVVSRHCSIFCKKVAAAGYHTGIYSSASWFDAYIKGMSKYDRWIAHWGMNDGSWAVNLNGRCSIHQYTSIPLDKNVFYTDPNLMSN